MPLLLSAGGVVPAASAGRSRPARAAGSAGGALCGRLHAHGNHQQLHRTPARASATGGGGGDNGAANESARPNQPHHPFLPLARAAANVAVAAGCACLAVGAPWLAAPPPPAAFALTSSAAPVPGAVVAAAAAAAPAPSTTAGPTRDALLALSSELEDELLRASRELDARAGEALGEALSALRSAAAGGGASADASSSSSNTNATKTLSPAELEADANGRELLREVWEVVDAAYLDARGAGFDRDAWRAARDRALAAPPGRYADSSGAAARRAAAGMLARAVRDPYTRLIPPEEFAAMARYDVTGVGLNLGTAEEYVRKTGRALPARVFGGGGGEGLGAAATGATTEAVAAAPATTAPATPPPPGTGGVWVVGLSKGSAADVAGVRQGDEVVAVDGARLDSGGALAAALGGPAAAAASSSSPPQQQQISPFQASALIAGDLLPDGRSADDVPASQWQSSVRLTLRDDAGTERTLELPRRARQALASPVTYRLEERRRAAGGNLLASLLPSSSASSATGENADEKQQQQQPRKPAATIKVGVVAVSSFNARAQRDVASAAASLRAQGAEALELDLRGNRGGLVSEGLEVARLFVGGGAPLVVTQGAAMAAEPPRASAGPAPFGDGGGGGGGGNSLPLTVLVDGHTASASEIVAGALRDNCRAVLVGPGRTYGKGLIQSVYELSAKNAGGIALTVGKYVTPRGVDIDREGLKPDFTRWPVAQEKAEEVLRACRAEGGGVGGGERR
jgi:C-terminal processing protease CtpA/Prc